MGQNRYRLFEKNECMKIEQDIETLHNPIDFFWVELELKDWDKIIVVLF